MHETSVHVTSAPFSLLDFGPLQIHDPAMDAGAFSKNDWNKLEYSIAFQRISGVTIIKSGFRTIHYPT